MMEAKDLGKLLRTLRRNGVTRYQDGELKIQLGAAPVRQVAQHKQIELPIQAVPTAKCDYCSGTGKIKVDDTTQIVCGFCNGTGAHKQAAEEKVLFASAN